MKKVSLCFLLFVSMFAGCNLFKPGTIELETITEEQIINPSTITYSYPMSIYNDTLAIARSSSVHFYHKKNDQWEFTESLPIAEGVRNLDIYDKLLLIDGDDSTMLYERKDSSWTTTKLMESSYAEVSVYNHDIMISFGDEIHFFHYNGASWEKIGTSPNLSFIQKIKLRDNMAIVGEYPYHDSRGLIRTYTKNDHWELKDTLTAWDAREADFFAYSIDVSDNYLISGAFGDDSRDSSSTGSAYIFKRENDEWVLDEKLFIDNADNFIQFGRSVAISNSFAVIGAPYDREKGFFAGAAYLYEKSSSGWELKAKLLASDGKAYDEFGNNVIISDNNNIIVGAKKTDKKYYFRP